MNEKSNDRDTVTVTNLESDSCDESLGTEKGTRFTAPVSVVFHSIRKRLADNDNLSGKAVLDGIVQAGILADDSAKFVSEVSHTQVKGKTEKTIVTITEIA